MKIGMHSASTNTSHLDDIVAEVARAEQLGLASYWAPMLAGQDTLTVFAVAGREVPRIELGTAVVPIPLRTSFALAQQLSTVQQAVGGRLVVGVGTSHESLTRTLFGQEWGAPLPTARAFLSELKDVLSGTGSRKVATAVLPAPPVLLGAVNPAMAKLAAELADGIVTWAAGVATLRDVVREAARDRVGFRVVAALPVCVTEQVDAALQLVHARFGGSDALPSYQKVLAREGVHGVAELALVGTASEVCSRLDELADVGVTDFTAHVLAPTPQDAERTWDVLAGR